MQRADEHSRVHTSLCRLPFTFDKYDQLTNRPEYKEVCAMPTLCMMADLDATILQN